MGCPPFRLSQFYTAMVIYLAAYVANNVRLLVKAQNPQLCVKIPFPPRLGNLSILGTNENYFESYSTFKFYKEQKWH